MQKPLYNLGDLVSIRIQRVTEEYYDYETLSGIIIERKSIDNPDQRLRDCYKIRSTNQDYWTSATNITLISSATRK